MSPAEIWAALKVSKQGAMDLLKPLLQAGLVEKIGGKKTGRYREGPELPPCGLSIHA
jgi:hypothetical protein